MYLPSSTFTLSESKGNATGEESEIVVLYADIRKFSSWSQEQAIDKTKDLVDQFYNSTWQIVSDKNADFCKLLGDGCLLLWEVGGKSLDLCIKLSFDATHDLHKKYFYENKDNNFNLPLGLGIGISTGKAVKIQPATFIKEFNEIDFVGYPMNCGARMQSLAGPYGTVIDSSIHKIIEENPSDFLYLDEPTFTRELHKPSDTALTKAKGMGGLSRIDVTDFRYITFKSTMEALWSVDGTL